MKAHYNLGLPGNDFFVEIEFDDTKKLMAQLTDLETIKLEPCGKCGSNNTFLKIKTVGDDSFYQMECRDCGAVLLFGVPKDGGPIYKKRFEVDGKGKTIKDDKGKATPIGSHGWSKFNPATGKNE